MKKILLLITLLAVLTSFSFSATVTQEEFEALQFELLLLQDTYEPANVENYEIREVPEFYSTKYGIEKRYMAIGYFTGDVKDGLPNGYGSLRISDYAADGTLIKKINLRGDFIDGVLHGDGTVSIIYEEEPMTNTIKEESGTFYHGLLNGEGNQIFSRTDSESNIKENIFIRGTYTYGVKNGFFKLTRYTQDLTKEDEGISITEEGSFTNGIKLGEWTFTNSENVISKKVYESIK